MKKNDVDIGELGETKFKEICIENGWVANPPLKDANGWDFIVEIPLRRKVNSTLDQHVPVTQVFVQVKSTKSKDKKCRIKLSNAQKMASQPIPTFLVLFEFDENNKVSNIYSRHIWNSEINEFLMKIRRQEIKGKLELNRGYTEFVFNEDDVHTNSIESHFIESISVAGSGYATEKAGIFEKVGYDGAKGKITFSYVGSVSDLVDWQIGKKKTIKINDWHHYDNRFGIELKLQTENSPNGELEITPTPKNTDIRFKFADETLIKSEAELFVPSLPGLPSKHFKYRLTLEAMEILVGNQQEKTINFKIDFSKPCKPESLKLISSFLNPEKAKSIGTTLSIQGEEVEFLKDFNFADNSDFDISNAPIDLMPLLLFLERFSAFSMVRDMKFSYLDVEDIASRYDMAYFACITNKIKITHHDRVNILKGIKFIYYYCVVRIKDLDYFTIFKSRVSKVSLKAKKTDIFIDAPSVIAAKTFSPLRNSDSEIKSLFLEVIEKNASMKDAISFGNFFDFISKAINAEDQTIFLIDDDYVKQLKGEVI